MDKFNYNTQFLIFTHIPKCGGTSFNRWINSVLSEKYLNIYPGSFEDKDVNNYIASGGHQKYGYNPFFDKNKELVYISIMRDPFTRFISFYNYVKSSKHHYLFNTINNYSTPLEFAEKLYNDKNGEISNLQTQMLSGYCDEISWEIAFENVKKNYFLVGYVENMYDFYQKLSLFFNEDIDEIPHDNKSEKKYEYDENLFDFIYSINKEDYKLYDKIKIT